MASKVGILVQVTEEEREAVREAALRAGLPMAAWARGVLLSSASLPIPSLVVPLPKLEAARVALAVGERKAAPLGRPSLDIPIAPRCSKHKLVLPCSRCAP